MKRQAGISLIEVLVAVLVLAIGLLGIAGLQTASLTTNNTSYQYTLAASLAQGMAERMRANGAGVTAGNYNLSAGALTSSFVAKDCETTGNTCLPAEQAKWDMGVWYAEVSGNPGATVTNIPVLTSNSSGTAIPGLPSGATSITCPAASLDNPGLTCLITVYWDPGRSASSSGTNYYSCDGTSTALTCYRLAFRP